MLRLRGRAGGRVSRTGTPTAIFRTQVQNALENLTTALAAHGLRPADTLKITVLIVDHSSDKLAVWSEEMRRVWEGHPLPTSTLIPVPRLASEGMLVEVDAIAYQPE